MTPRYILAFDTAMGGCSVAVWNAETGDSVSETRRMTRGQSEILVPMVQDILARAGRKFSDLGLIATTIGPGAFTGLRIGLSTARSFGLALDVPVAGVLTTEAIARMAQEKTNSANKIVVIIETKREDFYVQDGSDEPVAMSGNDFLLKYKDQSVIICGDGVFRFKAGFEKSWPVSWTVQDGCDLPDPTMIARIACENMKSGRTRPANPLYLRDSDVSQSSRPVRVIAGE